MSVNPGFGGQSFIRSSLQKIELLSKIRESRGACSFGLKSTVEYTTIRSRILRARALRSWSREAPYSSKATSGKIPGSCWKPLSRSQSNPRKVSKSPSNLLEVTLRRSTSASIRQRNSTACQQLLVLLRPHHGKNDKYWRASLKVRRLSARDSWRFAFRPLRTAGYSASIRSARRTRYTGSKSQAGGTRGEDQHDPQLPPVPPEELPRRRWPWLRCQIHFL